MSSSSLLITLVIVGVCMLALKLIFPNKSMSWYTKKAKIVISIGFIILILIEVIKLKSNGNL